MKPKTKPDPHRAHPVDELARNDELMGDKDIDEAVLDLVKAVDKGYEDQRERNDDTAKWWGLYNNERSDKQIYNGNSDMRVPLVHDAVEARRTRFVNQIFPLTGRYVEAVTSDGTLPDAHIALLEHYIRAAKMRTQVIPALVRSGDVEGQYTVYVSWRKNKRDVVWMEERPAQFDPGVGTDLNPDEQIMDIHEEEIEDAGPCVEVISDPDLLVLPATADSMSDALERGGSVSVIRRWSRERIEQMIEDGEIKKDAGKLLLKRTQDEEDGNKHPDTGKEAASAAGISRGRGTHFRVAEIWTKLFIKGKRRLVRVLWAGGDYVLSVKRNPYWSDLLPIISAPVDKLEGAFKGQSKVKPVEDFQVMANDAANEGMDSMAFSMLPVVMTDPLKNPHTGTMTMAMAAVWLADPNSTKIVQFPPLWEGSFKVIEAAKMQINQTLSVNPAQITQATGKKKLNQAEIANEQQIDQLTTADVVTVLEEEILNPILERMIELDCQFRDKAITIKRYGEMGLRAAMEDIPPMQRNNRWQFRWSGVEGVRSAQRVQQQISAMNVLRGVPPAMYKGYELDLVPVITQLVENAFGPRLAPLVFKDMKSQLSQNPDQENKLMQQGHDMPVHPMDDHQLHMRSHTAFMLKNGDYHGSLREHITKHQAMQAQKMGETAASMQGGPPPQGPGPAPPQPGAAVRQPMPMRAPPGAIHPDQMQDPSMMPRRAS